MEQCGHLKIYMHTYTGNLHLFLFLIIFFYKGIGPILTFNETNWPGNGTMFYSLTEFIGFPDAEMFGVIQHCLQRRRESKEK